MSEKSPVVWSGCHKVVDIDIRRVSSSSMISVRHRKVIASHPFISSSTGLLSFDRAVPFFDRLRRILILLSRTSCFCEIIVDIFFCTIVLTYQNQKTFTLDSNKIKKILIAIWIALYLCVFVSLYWTPELGHIKAPIHPWWILIPPPKKKKIKSNKQQYFTGILLWISLKFLVIIRQMWNKYVHPLDLGGFPGF